MLALFTVAETLVWGWSITLKAAGFIVMQALGFLGHNQRLTLAD